jgi:2-polyprenyl-3-methyl-5-hydroxy-6-metoxy-1,4-benzoquinol methylase
MKVLGDATFDVVLQIDTLQHLRNTEVMLRRDSTREPYRRPAGF